MVSDMTTYADFMVSAGHDTESHATLRSLSRHEVLDKCLRDTSRFRHDLGAVPLRAR